MVLADWNTGFWTNQTNYSLYVTSSGVQPNFRNVQEFYHFQLKEKEFPRINVRFPCKVCETKFGTGAKSGSVTATVWANYIHILCFSLTLIFVSASVQSDLLLLVHSGSLSCFFFFLSVRLRKRYSSSGGVSWTHTVLMRARTHTQGSLSHISPPSRINPAAPRAHVFWR